MDSSGPEFCLLCRSALPTDSDDWYTQHLENVHTVYFHIDLFMALTFVGDEKLGKLTSYIKSISKIQTSDADRTVKQPGDDNEVVDAASESTVLKRDNAGLKRKSLDEIESKPSKLKKDSVEVEPEAVIFCGPFRCTECGWKSDPTKNALADSALKHWSEVHGSVLKMELEDVPTEELVTLQELFKFVAKCSLPECLAVYGSSTNKNDCLLKIKLHWITQHRNVPQVSDNFKHVFLVNTETPQSIAEQGAGNAGTIEVDEEDSDVDLDDLEMQNNADEVANLMDKIDQIKKDLNNEKLKSISNDDSENNEKVSQDFGKSGMTCYDCGQANLNKRNFLQHWNSNHFGKDIAHFRLVCNDTKMKAEAKNLLNFICKCSSLDCGIYIGVNHSSKVLEGAVKDHYSNAHAKTLSEISTPEHYIYLDTNMKTIQSQNETKIEFRDSPSSPVDCLIDGCKSTKIKKYSRHYQQKHKHIPVEQIKVRSADEILGLSDLYTWILECGAPNCSANIFSVQKNASVKDSFRTHWSKNHPDLGENHIYKTVLSPSDSTVLVKTPKKDNSLRFQETSSPLDSSFRDASSPFDSSFKEASSSLLESSFKETSSSPVDCLLEGCKPKDSKDIAQYIRHYRQNHEDIPVDQIKVRSVQSGNILGLSDLFSWVLQCEAPNCSAIKTSVQRNNSVRDTFRKHWNRSHPNLGKKFLYKTILSPSNSTLLEIKSISPKKENSLKSSPDTSKMTNMTMECTLCQHSTRTALLHWRSHHPEHPATSLRMRRLEDDKIMNLRGVYNIVLKCKMNKCAFVTVANKGRPISQPKKLMKKHLEDEHEEENLDDNMEEVESLGYVCLMEGCQMAVGSRKELVEHHETHHGKMTEILARDLDTDEKKGLVELFKIVKECGFQCGKIFYSDVEEDLEKELAGHCKEEHPGMKSRQPIDLSKEMAKEQRECEDESLVMKDWQDNDVQEELSEQVETNERNQDELEETDGHKQPENHMDMGVNDSSREELIEKELKELNEQLHESDLSQEDEDLDNSQEDYEGFKELEEQIDSNETSQEKLVKATINEPAYSLEDGKVHEEQVKQMITEMSQEKLAEDALENLNVQDDSQELDEFNISEEELTEEALEKLNELAEEALEKLKESLNEQDDLQEDEEMDENEKIEEQVSEEENEMSDDELDEEEVEETLQEVDEVHDKLDAEDEKMDENDMMEEELSEEEHEISEDELEEEEVEDILKEDDKAEADEELDEQRDGMSLEVLSEELKESGEQDEELEELDEHDEI